MYSIHLNIFQLFLTHACKHTPLNNSAGYFYVTSYIKNETAEACVIDDCSWRLTWI